MEPFISGPLGAWTRAAGDWVRFWGELNRNVIETNREAAAAFGLSAGERTRGATEPAFPAMTYREGDWTVERSVERRADLGVGDSVTFSKRISDTDVRGFARVSGDTNRLHLDDEFARRSRFGERIAHGTLVAGAISAALARLPGLTIYLSQDVEYLRPVPVGERVTATCEVVEDLGDGRFRLTTVVTDEDGEVAIDGEAVVLIDDMPGDSDDD